MDCNEKNDIRISDETLTRVLSAALNENIIRADYKTERLQGGTIGDVRLVTGTAVTAGGTCLPYKLIYKTHKIWIRFGDPDSWRREYDLYTSDFTKIFTESFRWPKCYHTEIDGEEFRIWMEYIDGVSGGGLSVSMLEQAAAELGRFQGRIYSQPELLRNVRCLGDVDFMKNNFNEWHTQTFTYDFLISEECRMPEHIKQMYRDNKKIIRHDKTVEYNCLRFPECDLPVHLKQMLTDADESSEKFFNEVKRLPVVLCHRDFWIENIFMSDGKCILIDWDTTGWGYLFEDIACLIFDETDTECIDEYYRKLVPAYLSGLSEYFDVSSIKNFFIREMILIKFGYRILQYYMFETSPDVKNEQIAALQKVYEMKSSK